MSESVDQEPLNEAHGERFERIPRPLPKSESVVLVLLVLGLLFVFGALFFGTDPDPRGHGTHEQLGMTPCSWPLAYGKPCVTCGVTTSASLLLHGRPIDSFLAQPFGMLLTLTGLVFIELAISHLVRRECLVSRIAFWPWAKIYIAWVLLLFAAWYYKIQTFDP